MTKKPNDQPKKKRTGSLKTTGDVLSELGKTYREFKNEEISGYQAKTRVHILKEIRATIESGDLESRVEALEKANEPKK